MASKSKFDAFLFGRNYERNDIHNKSAYSNEHVLELVNGQSNQQYRKGKKVGPSHRPPVPVVLDPTPAQITPIGTIPIYYRKSS
ncbi:hypothetical protein D1953_15055 [Peribacillus asahii]|uniref:Uncharacterized protein n=1 Tax=Peribacillus asahii TaxID=228899 RepID=A0A398B1C3_9BACI|nr:hypothetical protein [Peribacillus asahii]RID83625.1 hypothetical protein D1953_15055 [Peribacillus asahii]